MGEAGSGKDTSIVIGQPLKQKKEEKDSVGDGRVMDEYVGGIMMEGWSGGEEIDECMRGWNHWMNKSGESERRMKEKKKQRTR